MKRRFFAVGALLVALIAASTSVAKAQHASGVEWSGTNWMSFLPDNALVCQLSLPGAHDAATAEGWATGSGTTGKNYSTAQDKKVVDLWNVGVRVFDFRPDQSSTIKLSHGTTIINKTLEKQLQEIISYLNDNPTEFAIFHLYPGGNGTMPSQRLANLFNNANYKPYFVPFKADLTVGEMRGKILALSRSDYEGYPFPGGFLRWWGEHNFEENKDSYIIRNDGTDSSNNYDFQWETSAQLFVQDFANTSGGNVNSKMASMGKLLDFSTRHCVYQRSQLAWTINFASAYSQESALGISLSDGYRDNAGYTNKYIIDYLATHEPGPTGILMMDFLATNTTTYNNSRYNTHGNNLVYGSDVLEAVIDNNFRCTTEQLIWNSHESLLPVTFSTSPDVVSTTEAGTPPEGYLRPSHRTCPVWGDFNGDGNMDFYYGGTSWTNGWQTVGSLVTTNGDGTFTYQDDCGLPRTAFTQGSVTLDFNQDGLLDLLLLHAGGNDTGTQSELMLVLNRGNNQFEKMDEPTLYNIGYAHGEGIEWNGGGKPMCRILSVGDYDNDGYPDLVAMGYSEEAGRFVKVLHNDNGEHFTLAQELDRQSEGSIGLGDFNQDGLLDLATTGWTDEYGLTIYFYIGTGDASSPFTNITEDVSTASGFADMNMMLREWGMYESALGVFDFDQDGRNDIIINGTNKNGWTKKSAILLNKSEKDASVFTFREQAAAISSFSLPANYIYELADLNGDDYVDIVQKGWTSDYRNWANNVCYSNGEYNSYVTNLFWDTTIGGQFTDRGMSFGDFNGDGLLDLAQFDYTDMEQNRIFYNTTAATVQAPEAPGNVTFDFDLENKTITLRWAQSALAKSGGRPMYNFYIKNTETGKTRMLNPAVISSGRQMSYAHFGSYFLSTDENPSFTFTDLEEGSYELGVQAVSYNYQASPFATINVELSRSDVNLDGQLSFADLEGLVNILLGIDTTNPRGDVNRDDSVTLADVTALVNKLTGGSEEEEQEQEEEQEE